MEDAVLIKKEIILRRAEIFSSVVALGVGVQSLWSLTTRLILSVILANSSSMVFCCS